MEGDSEWLPTLLRGGMFKVRNAQKKFISLFVFMSQDLGVFIQTVNLGIAGDPPFASVGICNSAFSQRFNAKFGFTRELQAVTLADNKLEILIQFATYSITLHCASVPSAHMWSKAFRWLLVYSKSPYFLQQRTYDLSLADRQSPTTTFTVEATHLVRQNRSGQAFHVQFMPVSSLHESVETVVERVEFYAQTQHPNLVGHVGVLGPDQQKRLWFLTEHCMFGDVVSLLQTAKTRPSELQLAYLASGIVKGLVYLHHNNLCHQRVTAHNLFLDQDAQGRLGMIHPSDAADTEREQQPSTLYEVGPPERVTGVGLSDKSDIWSLGMSLLHLLLGKLPLQNKPVETLEEALLTQDPFALPSHSRLPMSAQLRDFLELCLLQDAFDRPSAAELLQHAFLTNLHDTQLLEHKSSPWTSVLLKVPLRRNQLVSADIDVAESKAVTRQLWASERDHGVEQKLRQEAAEGAEEEPEERMEEEEAADVPLEPSAWRVVLSPTDHSYIGSLSQDSLGVEDASLLLPKQQDWLAAVVDSYIIGGFLAEHRVFAIQLTTRENCDTVRGKRTPKGKVQEQNQKNRVLRKRIERRYNDFLGLYNMLCTLYPTCIIPPLPAQTAQAAFDDDITSERMRQLEWFLCSLAKHPVLADAPEVAMFLLTDRRTLSILKAKENIMAEKFKLVQARIRLSATRQNDKRQNSNAKDSKQASASVSTSNTYVPQQPGFWDTLVGDATTVTEYAGERMFDGLFSRIDKLNVCLGSLNDIIDQQAEHQQTRALGWYAFAYDVMDAGVDLTTQSSYWQWFYRGCLLQAKSIEVQAEDTIMRLWEPLQWFYANGEGAMDLLDRHGFIVYETLQTGYVPTESQKHQLNSKQERDAKVQEISNAVLREIEVFDAQRKTDLSHTLKQYVRRLIEGEKQKQRFWTQTLAGLQEDAPIDAVFAKALKTKSWVDM